MSVFRAGPNTRVQRTRSSPSALREPLTRHPLGGIGHRSLAFLVPLISLVLVIACSSQTGGGASASLFGAIDPTAPALAPEKLSLVNDAMTLGEIFHILGPAHAASSLGCSSTDRCWEWRFTNGDILVIPVDSNPNAKPRSFKSYLVDYAA